MRWERILDTISLVHRAAGGALALAHDSTGGPAPSLPAPNSGQLGGLPSPGLHQGLGPKVRHSQRFLQLPYKLLLRAKHSTTWCGHQEESGIMPNQSHSGPHDAYSLGAKRECHRPAGEQLTDHLTGNQLSGQRGKGCLTPEGQTRAMSQACVPGQGEGGPRTF